MKKLLLVLILCYFFIVSNAQTANDFKKLHWLLGEWDRTNVTPGKSGIERWEAASAMELQGWGISMKGSDTTFIEKIKLMVKDNHIYYVADVPENKDPVFFKLTSIGENGFTCENPQHDFPKKITYLKKDSQLKATISGDGKSVEYLFIKRKY